MKKLFTFCRGNGNSQIVTFIINSRIFSAIASSTMAMVPLLVACGILELISSITFVTGLGSVYSWLELVKNGLEKIAPIMLNVFLSFHFAKKIRVSPISLTLINLGVLVVVSSFFSDSIYFFLDVNISFSMFLGVATGILCERIIKFTHDYRREKILKWYFIGGSLATLIVLYLCFSFVMIWSGEIHQTINWIAQSLYPSDFNHGLIYLLFCGGAWFFGINGENLLETQLRALTISSAGNMNAWHAGHTSLSIISNMFFDVWCNIGGSGATLSLAVAMLFSDKKYYRKLLTISAPLSIFNTNDTLLFGVPIVLNPLMIFPFIFVPILNYIIAYVATLSGLIPPLQNQVSWVTPPLVNAWLCSGGSVRTVILQIVVVCIGAKIYHVFLRGMECRVNFNDKKLQGMNMSLFSQSSMVSQPTEFDSVRSNDYLSEMNDHFIAQDKINKLRKTGDFILYFQPQVKMPENEIIGFEALIRHEDKNGKITPPIFLEHYERLNLMPEIDLWVLQNVINIIHTRLSEFRGYTMCINMSPQTLSDSRLIPAIKKCLVEPLPNGWTLEFEITESQKINSPKTIAKCLSEIKSLGIKVALDDFGSGYSTISYLNEYDLDKIKLDRGLVRNLDKDSGFGFLKNVVTLCQGTKATVLIEGVETEAEREKVFSAGVLYAQGFLFYRPLPLKDLYSILDKQRNDPIRS